MKERSEALAAALETLESMTREELMALLEALKDFSSEEGLTDGKTGYDLICTRGILGK